MPIRIGDAVLTISADVTQLNKDLGRVQSDIKKNLGNILNEVKDVGIALSGIGAAIAGGLGLAVKAFADAQENTIGLTAALAANAGAVGLTRQQLDDMARSLSRVTTVDDDVITGAQAMLLQFSDIGKNVFPQAIQAALDMSTALHENLEDSIMKVGRALNDPSGGLKGLRFLTDTQKDLIKETADAGDKLAAQNLILDALGVFAGRAQAETLSLKGQLEQLKNEAGNLQEVIGGALQPVLATFSTSLKDLLIDTTDWAKAHPELVTQLTLAAAAVGGLMLVIGPLLIALPTLVTSFGLLAVAAAPIAATIAAIGAAFLGWKLGEWIGGIQLLGKSLGDWVFQLTGLQRLFGASQPVLDAHKRATEDQKFATDKLIESQKKHAIELEGQKIKLAAATAASNLHTISTKNHKTAVDAAKKALEEHNRAIEKTLDDQEALTRVNETSAEQWKDLKEWTKKNSDNLIEMGLIIRGQVQPALEVLSADVGGSDGLTNRMTALEDAYKALGITSEAESIKMRDKFHDAFVTISNDATATQTDIENAWTAMVKNTDETWGKAPDKLEVTNKEIGTNWNNQVSTIVTDFGKGVADILFKGGTFKTNLEDLFTEIGKSISRKFIENAFTSIANAMSGLADTIGGSLSKILGGISSSSGSSAGSGAAGGGGGGGGLTQGLLSGALGVGIGLLVNFIAKLFGRGKIKEEDTEIAQKGWAEIWKLQGTYANAPRGATWQEELQGRTDVLSAGIGAWNEMARQFKRPESRESQRPYIFDWINAINKDFSRRYGTFAGAPPIDLSKLPVQPLALGGIVNRATLALLGESGPEAVIPLGRGGRGASGIQQTINFHNANSDSTERLMNRVNRRLVRSLA